MSIYYLDFENNNFNPDLEINGIATLNLNQEIPPNQFDKCCITKLDLDASSNWYFMRVPLQPEQPYYDNTSYIPGYDMKDANNNYIYNNDNGYFITIFKFCLCYLDSNNNLKIEEFPIIFKSPEVEYNKQISYKLASNGTDIIWDNFNNYFECKTADAFLSNVNNCIKEIINKKITGLSNQILSLLPKFFTKNNQSLSINFFSYGKNSDLQPDNNDILQVEYPEEVQSNTYVGHTSPGPLFAIGLNKSLSNLLYDKLVVKEYKKDGPMLSQFNISENYYFLQLELILQSSICIDEVGGSSKYNISEQLQLDFYDKGDLKLITIKSSNISIPPLYANTKKKDYLLINDDISYDVQNSVIFKMSINNNQIIPGRFIYSNSNISGNYSWLKGGINATSLSLSFELVDKYNHSYLFKMPYLSKIYAQIACFK